jgi:hypothetical protein
VYSPKHRTGRCLIIQPLRAGARTPPPTLLFTHLNLSKSKHPKMQVSKTTAPHTGTSGLSRQAVRETPEPPNPWQRRDEPDLGSFVQRVKQFLRKSEELPDPLSEDKASAKHASDPDLKPGP